MIKKIIIYLSLALLGLAAIVFYQNISLNDGRLHIVFCDVGQGDATFIRTPKGTDLLIDGGPDQRVLDCLGRHMPFWDKTIELVILTHPHADHLAGLINIIDRYTLIQFLESSQSGSGEESQGYQRLKEQLSAKKINSRQLSAGDSFKTGDGLQFVTLWPERDFTTSDPNDMSIVLLLSFGSQAFLLPGDAGVDVDYWNNINKEIDVLKVSHHGSRTGTSQEFIDRTRPRLAVISVGKNNRYGHPHSEVIKILNDLGIKTLRTDQNGEVEVISDGQSWSFKTK